jgi:RNA polymerase sigma factor (sigma-70 family)
MTRVHSSGLGCGSMNDVTISSDAWVSRTYTDVVRALALYCGDQGVAEDCAQEALFRLWRRHRALDDPRAWVFRCAFNIASSTFRRRAAERRAVKRSLASPTILPSPIERDLDLQRGISALPDRQRQAILLRYLADLDIPAVALAMGCSPGTVKSHLTRGLASLRNNHLLSESTDVDSVDITERPR